MNQSIKCHKIGVNTGISEKLDSRNEGLVLHDNKGNRFSSRSIKDKPAIAAENTQR